MQYRRPRAEHSFCAREVFVENVRYLERFKNRGSLYEDRFQAGEYLAQMLSPAYQGDPHGIVLAIPSGGVPVGLVLSRRLQMGFDLAIVRKIQIPGNTEAGFGAMTQEGDVFLNRELLAGLRLSQEEVERQKEAVRDELERRNRLFRGSRPFPDLTGRTVLLTDDGLASGYTMVAAATMVRNKQAARIVVAVPTAPLRSLHTIAPLADEIYSPHIQDRGGSFAVAAAYRNWRDLSSEEVVRLVEGQEDGG
jgi:predicted phosphoribosyltransferase